MLVLSRKPGQAVRIGGAIEVRVLGRHGAGVQLGFTAPRACPILREELIETEGVCDVEAPSHHPPGGAP